jgi:hypothetical protein
LISDFSVRLPTTMRDTYRRRENFALAAFFFALDAHAAPCDYHCFGETFSRLTQNVDNARSVLIEHGLTQINKKDCNFV